jgi:hypothetical protein
MSISSIGALIVAVKLDSTSVPFSRALIVGCSVATDIFSLLGF